MTESEQILVESSTDDGIPPKSVYEFREPAFNADTIQPVTDGVWESGLPIIIDMGTYQTRAGYATQEGPAQVFPTLYSKYRDRKINRTYSLIGSSVYLDANSRSNTRSPFDGSLLPTGKQQNLFSTTLSPDLGSNQKDVLTILSL